MAGGVALAPLQFINENLKLGKGKEKKSSAG